jgi:hypothetical protein
MKKKEGKRKMTKAKKGLIITLFAAVMVFAFGAASVFASTTVPVGDKDAVWNDTYTSVTFNNITYPAATTFSTVDGLCTAVPDDSAKSSSQKLTAEQKTAMTVKFYDLAGSSIYADGARIVVTDYTRADFEAYLNNRHSYTLHLVQPAYTMDDPTATPESWTSAGGRDAGELGRYWRFSYNPAAAFDPDNEAAQEVTVLTTVSTRSAVDAQTVPDVINGDAVAAVTYKVGAKVYGPADAVFYMDGDKDHPYTGGDINLTYNGADQVLAMGEIEGLTATYYVMNTSGKYVEGPISVKNVVKNARGRVQATNAKATVTDGKTTATYIFNISVYPAAAPTFGFNTDDPDAWYAVGVPEFYVAPGAIYDPNYFIAMTPGGVAESAAAKAAAADESQWKAYYADRYEITSVEKKALPDYVRLTVAQKKDLDTDALNKKYADLLANYNGGAELNEATTAYVHFTTAASKFDHIYFTEAPNMTYKYKVIKKKAKSFTVAAVADSGKTVTYKIDSPSKKITIDSATGKIKVAKKLKKGTYKVKVYAMTAAGEGYYAESVDRTLTIKIKK